MTSMIQEKRKYERFNADVTVLYRNAQTINTALLKNINMGGMQLVSSEALPVNTVLTVTLSVSGLAANSPKIMARVLWSIKIEEDKWLMGTNLITNFSQISRFMTDVFASSQNHNN